MRILVTGGAGFIGSVLVPKLLAAGHEVVVLDLCWFGNHLPEHPALSVIQRDIRSIEADELLGFESVVHLAAIANDPSAELAPRLSLQVNCLGTQFLAEAAARAKVKRFIHFSSGSVYGISDDPEVMEETPLRPISIYNETKMASERIVASYADPMCVTILRPATVCGRSPRQRLDVVVNLMVNQALSKGEIAVLGGKQMRPNVHIGDLTDACIMFLDRSQTYGPFEAFNVGGENLSVLEIARKVVGFTHANIRHLQLGNDPRSYRLSDLKLRERTTFRPKRFVDQAIGEMVIAWHDKEWTNDARWHNVHWMRSQKIGDEDA